MLLHSKINYHYSLNIYKFQKMLVLFKITLAYKSESLNLKIIEFIGNLNNIEMLKNQTIRHLHP